jgi:molecular chaperone GrpE
MTDWPDTESLMARLREWLDRTRAEANRAPLGSWSGNGEPEQPAGLLQLVAEFTALRHELKLQTKSARGLEEQTGQAIAALGKATDELHTIEAKEAAAAEKAAEPFVRALVELDEALERGAAAVEAARERISVQAVLLQRQLDELADRQPRWKRRLCRGWHMAVGELLARHGDEGQQRLFDSLAEGYSLV